MKERKCRCGAVIPPERLEILPNTYSCVQCSTERPYVGCMVYDHKTAPRLAYVRPENTESVEMLKRFTNRSR